MNTKVTHTSWKVLPQGQEPNGKSHLCAVITDFMCDNPSSFANDIFSCTQDKFNEMALAVFQYQYKHLKVYRQFCEFLNVAHKEIKHYSQIPFIPIGFFKNHKVLVGDKHEVLFKSSGTTQTQRAHHFIKSIALYEKSLLQGFDWYWGNELRNKRLFALLPNYIEQGDASLVYMVEALQRHHRTKRGGFYLHNLDELTKAVKQSKAKGENVILWGVTYALLQLAEKGDFVLDENDLVVETGGMKGRRKELTRSEVHQNLAHAFGVKHIASEYGMTELLSQGYARKNGQFTMPPWCKVLARDLHDPKDLYEHGSGALNIIDLANIYSCSFIATDDLVKIGENKHFDILGRLDHSDIRGCNLLAI